MAFKFNIKSDDFTTYGRMFDYAKTNPRFNENALSIITNEQSKQQYIYTYAMLNNVEKFNNEGFDETYYEQIASVDPLAASSYIGYKAFGDYDVETEKMWEDAREHYGLANRKLYLNDAEKAQNVLNYYNKKTGIALLKLLDEIGGSFDWLVNAAKAMPTRPENLGGIGYKFTTVGKFFRDWRSNMDETNERLNDDRWYKFLSGSDRTIDEESSEIRKLAYYNTDLYSSLEDAFDGIQLGGKISAGDMLDFVHDGLMSAAKMSLNFIPVVGQGLYWSTVAVSSIEESRNIKDPLLLAVKMVGSFAIEYISEQMFYDTFIRSGLFNPKKAFLSGKMNPILYALSSLGIDMTTNAIEEMLAEVMNFGMDFTLREFYGKTQDAAVFDELPETFSEAFNQVAVAGLSGAFIGLLGAFGDIVKSQAVTSVDADGKSVRLGKFAAYQFRSIQRMMGNLGNAFDNRNSVVEQLRNKGLSDNEIATHKDYIAATEADNKAMALYNIGMAQIEIVLRKNGYSDAQIDANKQSVQAMFTYYKGLEYNFHQNIIPNRSRDVRKADKESGRTFKRSVDYFNNIESYEKAFKDRFGGKVTINVNIDSYTDDALALLAKRSGYDAIVVGDIGAVDGVKAESPMITIKGEQFKGTVVGDVLYIDSTQYNQVGTQSKLLQQIIVNKIATNIVGNIYYELGTAADQVDFYHTLAGVFGGDVTNGPIRFQQMVEKYGVEGARSKIIETFLNSPAAIRSLYVENNRLSKKVFRVINDSFKELAKEFKDTIKNTDGLVVIQHYQAQHLNNVALGITSDIETFDKQLARDIRKVIKNTPLAQRADVIAQFAENNYARILKESKDISVAFMRTLGFVKEVKVGSDIHLQVKESVSEFLSTLGFTFNHAKSDASYTSFSDLSDAEMAMAILSNVDLQYALTVEIPQFRNAFVLFLQDFILMDGISDEHLNLARNTLKSYVLSTFKDAPDAIKNSIKQSVLKVEKKLIKQGRITADGQVVSAIESATGFMGSGAENIGDLSNAWQSWNIPHKVMASRAFSQLKAFAPKLFGKMKNLGDVYNYLYSGDKSASKFVRDVFFNNKVTYKDGVFSINVMDALNLFGVSENSLSGKSNLPLMLFVGNLINDGNVITQDDFLSNKTLNVKLADLTNHKIATAFLKSFGYALTKDIKGNIVSLKITEVRGFMNNKYSKDVTQETSDHDVGNNYVRNVITEIGYGKPVSLKTLFNTKAYSDGLILTPAQRKDVNRALNSVNVQFENRRKPGQVHVKAKFDARTNTIIVYANESIYENTHVFNELLHEMTHAILTAQKMGGLEFSYLYALTSQKGTKFSKLTEHIGSLDVANLQQIGRLNTKGIAKLLKSLGINVDSTTQSADFVAFVKAYANLAIAYRTDARFAHMFNKDAVVSNNGFADALYLVSQAELLASDATKIDSLARTLMPELSEDSKIIALQRQVETLARKALDEKFDNRYVVFSQEKDSGGNALSVKQVERFKNLSPELFDENGRLRTLFHGSRTINIKRFNPLASLRAHALFFTNDRTNASSYAGLSSDTARIYEVHLEMYNPYVVDAKGAMWHDLTNNVENTYTYGQLDDLHNQKKINVLDLTYILSDIADIDTWRIYNGNILSIVKQLDIEVDYSLPDAYLLESLSDEDLETVTKEYYRQRDNKSTDTKTFLSDMFKRSSLYLSETTRDKIVGRMIDGEFYLGPFDTTNDIVARVIKEGKYDGVIFRNIVDYGNVNVAIDANWKPHDVYVVFKPEQVHMVRDYDPYDTSVKRESFSRQIVREQLAQQGVDVTQQLDETEKAKPFIKWVGGKKRVLPEINKRLPATFNNYFEPFIGGGAVLFNINPQKAVINDYNKEISITYKLFQDEAKVEKLRQLLDIHEENHSEEYFKKIRALDRDGGLSKLKDYEIAARFIYLNKAGFNGSYNVNKKGEFNTAFGHKPKIYTYKFDNFQNLVDFFKRADITVLNGDFANAVKDAKAGDFVYLDPPYDPISKDGRETPYTKQGFSKQDQIRVAEVFKELDKRGVKVMLSNHNTDLIRSLYKGYNIDSIDVHRSHSGSVDARGKVKEVIITNYGQDITRESYSRKIEFPLLESKQLYVITARNEAGTRSRGIIVLHPRKTPGAVNRIQGKIVRADTLHRRTARTDVKTATRVLDIMGVKSKVSQYKVHSGIAGVDATYIQSLADGGYKALVNAVRDAKETRFENEKDLNKHLVKMQSLVDELVKATDNVEKYYAKWKKLREANLQVIKTKTLLEQHGNIAEKVKAKEEKLSKLQKDIEESPAAKRGKATVKVQEALGTIDVLREARESGKITKHKNLALAIMETVIKNYKDVADSGKLMYGMEFVEQSDEVLDEIMRYFDNKDEKNFGDWESALEDIYNEYFGGVDAETTAQRLAANRAMMKFLRYFRSNRPADSYEYGTFTKNLMDEAYDDVTQYASFMEEVHYMWERLSWETKLLSRVQSAEEQISKAISGNYKPTVLSNLLNNIINDVNRYFENNPKNAKGRYEFDFDTDLWNPLVQMLLDSGRIFDRNGNLNLAGQMFESFVKEMVTKYDFNIEGVDDPSKFFKEQVKGEKRSILKAAKESEKRRQAALEALEQERALKEREVIEAASKIKIDEIKVDDTIAKNQRISIVRFVEDYERITNKVLTAVEKDMLLSLFDYTTGEGISDFVGLTTDGKIQYMIMNTNIYDDWIAKNQHIVSKMSIEAWQELANAIMELSYHGFVPDIARINFMNLAHYFFDNRYTVSSRSANAKALMKIGGDLNAIMGVWVSSSGTILAKQKQIKGFLSSFVDIDINYVHVVKMAFIQHIMQSENISQEEAVKRIEHESFSLTIGQMNDIFNRVGEATKLNIVEFKALLRKTMAEDAAYQEDVKGKLVPKYKEIDELLEQVEHAMTDGILTDGSKLSEEELKISYKAMDDLWRSAVEMRNYKAIEFMRALFNEKAQQLARSIDFKGSTLLGNKGNTPEERRKNQLAGLSALGRQFNAFRFMAMLSNPSVYVKNRYLNATNSAVQRRIIDPIGAWLSRKYYEKWQAQGKLKTQGDNFYIQDKDGNYVNITIDDKGKVTIDRVDHQTKAYPINRVLLEKYEQLDAYQQEGLSAKAAYLQYFTTLNKGKTITKEAQEFVKTHLIENGFLKHIQERSSNVYFKSLSPEAFDKYLDRTNPFVGTSKTQRALYKAYNFLYEALEGEDFKTMRKNIEHTVTIMVENLELYKGDITYETEVVNGKTIKRPVLGQQLAKEMDRISQVAFEKSLEVVFKAPNKMHDLIKKFGNSHPLASFLQQALIPFPRVATNIFSQIIKFSPLGFIDITKRMLLGRNADSAIDQNFLTRLLGPANAKLIPDYGSSGVPIDTAFFDRLGSDMAKASVGSAFFILGSLLSAFGILGIKLEKDPVNDYRGYVMAIDLMGEKYHIDISSALPTAMAYPLLLGASLVNIDRNLDFGSVFEQLVNLTFLGNILDSTRSYKIENIIPDMVEDYVVSFSPSIFRTAWRLIFNHGQLQYTTGGVNWSWFKRVYERSLPYLTPRFTRLNQDGYRGAKADPYTGDRQMTYDNSLEGIILNLLGAYSPIAIQSYIHSDVQKISEQYGVKMATSYNTTLSFDGKSGNLTDAQRDLYNQERGRAYNYLVQKTIKTSAWRNANSEERTKILKGLGTSASTMAKASMWLANNNKNYYNYTSDVAINKVMKEYLKNPRFRKVGKLKEEGVNYYGQWL